MFYIDHKNWTWICKSSSFPSRVHSIYITQHNIQQYTTPQHSQSVRNLVAQQPKQNWMRCMIMFSTPQYSTVRYSSTLHSIVKHRSPCLPLQHMMLCSVCSCSQSLGHSLPSDFPTIQYTIHPAMPCHACHTMTGFTILYTTLPHNAEKNYIFIHFLN